MTKTEVFGVAWTDKMLGPLTLKKGTAQEAIDAANGIKAKGAGKVENVRAVKVTATDEVIDLL